MHMHASYNKSGYQHAVLFKNLFWLIKLYSSTPISFHNVASAQQILRPIRTKHYKYRLIISPPLGVQSIAITVMHVYVVVCLSARIPQNDISKLHEIFCTCYLWL